MQCTPRHWDNGSNPEGISRGAGKHTGKEKKDSLLRTAQKAQTPSVRMMTGGSDVGFYVS